MNELLKKNRKFNKQKFGKTEKRLSENYEKSYDNSC